MNHTSLRRSLATRLGIILLDKRAVSSKVSMNMWWGTNGGTYNLYENGILIHTEALANQTPKAQSSVTTLANRAKGNYEYRAELINYAGATSSEKMIVNVTK